MHRTLGRPHVPCILISGTLFPQRFASEGSTVVAQVLRAGLPEGWIAELIALLGVRLGFRRLGGWGFRVKGLWV